MLIWAALPPCGLRPQGLSSTPVPSDLGGAADNGAADATTDMLAVLGSHPTWMVERWIAQFGREATVALMAWNNTCVLPCQSSFGPSEQLG